MWPHSNRKKDEVTPVESRDRKKERQVAPGIDRNAVGIFQEYWILRTKVRCHTAKQHSQNPIRSKQQCTVCSLHLFRFPLPKNLRCFCWQVHIIAIARTWESIWRKWELGSPIGAYKYIYRAHSAVFSAAEDTFQSTQLGFPNWGFLPCMCNSEWPNWGDDPIGEPQLALRYFLIKNLS